MTLLLFSGWPNVIKIIWPHVIQRLFTVARNTASHADRENVMFSAEKKKQKQKKKKKKKKRFNLILRP